MDTNLNPMNKTQEPNRPLKKPYHPNQRKSPLMPLERALLTKGSNHGTTLMVKLDQEEVVILHKDRFGQLDDVYVRTAVRSGGRNPVVVFVYSKSKARK